MPALLVQRLGLRATVQDLGRPGFAHLGVPSAGAVDPAGLRTANRLVGNDDNAACLEVVVRGATLTTSGPTRIAVFGATWSIDGVGCDPTSAYDVDDGATIEIDAATGAYSYLAVAGGIDVAPALGSRSTDTLAGIGPDILKAGDVLPIGGSTGTEREQPALTRSDGPLRVFLGPRDDWFTKGAIADLLAVEWTVTPTSDRTGLRLSGPALARRTDAELPSEGMVSGAIQVPPDGQPILFLANHPTSGGYPVIAVVAAADVGRAAQHRPGSRLRFHRMA